MSVNSAKLPSPLGVVKEGPMVKAVIIRAVSLCVNGRRDHRHFVPVDGVAAIKMFDLEIQYDQYYRYSFYFLKEIIYFVCDFSWCMCSSPTVNESTKSGVRSTGCLFPKTP